MSKEFNPDLAGHDGTGRVKLHFRALEKSGEVSAEKVVTVPSGVSAFDAALTQLVAVMEPANSAKSKLQTVALSLQSWISVHLLQKRFKADGALLAWCAAPKI